MNTSNRIFKGHNCNGYWASDYTVIDLETTDIYISKAKIVEISAIKVRNNQIIDSFSSLINPGCHMPTSATRVNHITDEMVRTAPTIEEKIGEVLDFIGNDILVGYNIASFDSNIIYDVVLRTNGTYFSNDYLDLLYIARRGIANLENYKLETVCKYFELDTEGEHRALKDCYLTKECYDKLHAEYEARTNTDIKGVGERAKRRRGAESRDTKLLRELQEMLTFDRNKKLWTPNELKNLRYWLAEIEDIKDVYPFNKVTAVINSVLEDGTISKSEMTELEKCFADIIDPVQSNAMSDESSFSTLDKHFCITGQFKYGSRSEVRELIERYGGIIDNGVTRKTDFLLVGSLGSEGWKTKKYGSKVQKAMEIKEKGAKIEILTEDDFMRFTNSYYESE